MRNEQRPALEFAPALVDVEHRADGTLVLGSPVAPGPVPRQLGVWLRHWADQRPQTVFLAERRDGAWFELTYAKARRLVDGLSARLIEMELSPQRPIAILSDNSIEVALLQLAAMQIGVPAAAISPAYSLASRDLGKLRQCLEVLEPGLVFAANGATFERALATLPPRVTRLTGREAPAEGALQLEEWLASATDTPDARVEAAFAATGPDSIAKFLFTSGSTGAPKAVINTQRMLCSNQVAIRHVWPFLSERPPLIVDWLPWSHTFGGNHNFNLVLANGGSLYIDGGKPAPPLIGVSAENLRSIPPTLYFNVPRGFGLLLPLLEQDPALAARFFERLDLVFYAGAALPQDLWERLEALSLRETGQRVAMVSAWGSTETSPLVTSVHFPIERAGVIGLPVPGVRVKLVPTGSKFELRVAGPNVTPGYWKRPDLTAAAFDDEGFYCIGDAGALADPSDPSRGIVFDGRVAEDFKLSSGTWISAGRLRVDAIAHSDGVLADAVVCGHDTDSVRLLGIPDWARVNALTADREAAEPSERLSDPRVLSALSTALRQFNATRERPADRVTAVMLLVDPPSIDAGEITDKGYLNQAAVRSTRAPKVDVLLADAPHPHVVRLD